MLHIRQIGNRAPSAAFEVWLVARRGLIARVAQIHRHRRAEPREGRRVPTRSTIERVKAAGVREPVVARRSQEQVVAGETVQDIVHRVAGNYVVKHITGTVRSRERARQRQVLHTPWQHIRSGKVHPHRVVAID